MMRFILCIALLASFPSAVSAQSPHPPNIVFIFADDLGYGDISLFGAQDIRTPNIDSIGQNGVKFTDFYSASPVCTPSRAALLTGRYPIRMGIHHVFFPSSYGGMPEEEITIAEILQSAGYNTAIAGKWHLGHHEKFLPLNQGFDAFFGIPYSNDMLPLPMMSGNNYAESHINQDNLTQRLTDFSVEFIDRNAGSPFFLYVPHPMPHYPLHRSEDFAGVSERGLYGDVIEELDNSVGQILQALERNGVMDNTLIVFTSDNGPWILMGDDGGSPGSLRNGKGTTFEGGVRVPTVAAFPGGIAAGRQIKTPATMLDWFPTIVELSGLEPPADIPIDGESLLPMLNGGAAAVSDRALFFYSHGKIEAMRLGPWKYKRAFRHQNNPIPAFLRPFFGGEIGLKEHEALLFDLSKDPGEQNNVISAHQDIAEKLEAMMTTHQATMGPAPDNITPLVAGVNPTVMKAMSIIGKLALTFLAILIAVIAFIFYRLGRRARKT